MQVALRIQRFNPETDRKPYWEEYPAEVEPTDRLLDALLQVKWPGWYAGLPPLVRPWRLWL